MEKYVYLDWNVFKYLKQPRTDHPEDLAFRNALPTIKRKYRCPFSEAHIRDLLQSKKVSVTNPHFETDIELIANISEQFSVQYHKDTNEPAILKRDLREAIAETESRDESFTIGITPNFSPVAIDIDQMNDAELLKPIIAKHGGYLCSQVFDDLFALAHSSFENKEAYKDIRGAIQNLLETLESRKNILDDQSQAKALVIRYFELLLNDNEDDFSEHIDELLMLHFQMIGRPLRAVSSMEKAIILYMLLDFSPLFSERIDKKNGLSNIVRDGKHLIAGFNSAYFVTEDKSNYRKSMLVFRYFKSKTQVVKIAEFMAKFEIF